MHKRRVHVVVPARFASTRLPGKPLADILGKPMIVRVLELVSQADCHDYVAAVDDDRVLQAVAAAGYEAEMTSSEHASGSDRVMEVATKRGWADDDIVINVQGDEPLIPPAVVNAVAAIFEHDDAVRIATVREPISEQSSVLDPNVVKVVCDKAQNALYFSRAAIPVARDEGVVGNHYRHIGIYGFLVGALRRVTQLEVSDLERMEQLEQLRWLENGETIRVTTATESLPGGVDTLDDLARVIKCLSSTQNS